MGCGGSKKELANVPQSIQPINQLAPQALKCHPQEEAGKLPQLVLEGMSRILKMPMSLKRAKRPMPKEGMEPFAGIIEDPIPPVQGREPATKREEGLQEKTAVENPFPAPSLDDMQKEQRREIEGESGRHSELLPIELRKSETQEDNCESSVPSKANIPISTDTWIDSSTLPQTLLPSSHIGAEEEVRNTAVVLQRPATSQVLAAERLAKLYNPIQGLSPEPPEEQSEEEEDYDAAGDVARRAHRLAMEKAAEAEALRLAAEQRAEEERLLATQSAFMGAKMDEAASIISKYQ